MASTAAVLNILVTANTAQATTGLARTNTQLKTTAATANTATAATTKASAGMRALGTAAKFGGAAVVAGLAVGLKKAVEEAREADKAHRQTAAAIKSMGNQANVSVKHVEKMSQKLSLQSGIDDELVQSSQTLMLTFGNVRNEVGKNNKVFDQASQIALDLSARFNQDLSRASIMVGKALNDPILGLTNLSRIGVQFTEGQKKQIEGLVENGNLLKAQGLIMAELTRQTKGAAAAQADPFDKLGVAIDNVFEAMGKELLPIFAKWANAVAKFIHQMSTGKKAGGDFAKVLRAIGAYVKVMVGIWKMIIAGLALFTRRVIDAGKFGVKAFNWIVKAAKDVWHWIQKVGGAFSKLRSAAGDIAMAVARPWVKAAGAIRHALTWIVNAVRRVVNAFGTLKDAIPDINLTTPGEAILNTIGKQRGGAIGGSGSGDKVHAMLEPGEVVINRKAVAAMGGPNRVNRINQAIPRFAQGGKVGRPRVAGGVAGHMAQSAIDMSRAAANKWLQQHVGVGATWSSVDKLARQLGLNVSSAFRPGDPGFHGRRQAKDYSNGVATAAEHKFGTKLAQSIGPKLLELIHTPLGYSYDNGRRTAPFAQADHYDHVHVALAQRYAKGGPVKGRGARFVQGGGHWTADEAATLLYQIGASRSEARQLSRKVHGESGGRPGIVGHDPGGTSGLGLWQITTGFNDDLIRKYGGRNAMFDPVNNARAALDILRRQGIGAWYAGSSGAGSIMGKWLLSGEELLAQKSGAFKSQSDAVAYLMRRGVDKQLAQSTARKWMNQHPFGGTGGGKGKKKKKPGAGGTGGTPADAEDPFATINELIGEQNLLKLQNYNLGMAQHPILGIPNPTAPGMTPLMSAATAGVIAGATKPSVNSSAKVGKHKAKSHLGVAPSPRTRGGAKSHLGVAPVILIEDGAVNANRIRSLSGKEAKRAMKRAARRGNRGLPSGGGRGP